MTVAPGSALANFRDLGGLPTTDQRVTRPGVLYRSDAPMPGDVPPDAPSWPPSVVIDLRSGDEPIEPHPLRGDATVVHNVPLLGAARPRTIGELRGDGPLSMARLYEAMTERLGAEIGMVLETATRTEGPVLIHCAAGKDRTGVLVAVLLRAAGVTRDAVIEDYRRTAAAMPGVHRRMARSDAEVAALLAEFPEATDTPVEAIELVLGLVDDEPEGTRGWLTRHGVAPDLIDRWTARIIAGD